MNRDHSPKPTDPLQARKSYEPPRVVDSGRFEAFAQGCSKSVPAVCLSLPPAKIRY